MESPLREWRKRLGLTQTQVSQGSGLPQSTLHAIETGRGCRADTAYLLIQYSHGGLRLLDLVSEGLRKKVLKKSDPDQV